MVVCKFFLAGTCKFGRNCRYEHVFPDSDFYSDYSDYNPYVYDVRHTNKAQHQKVDIRKPESSEKNRNVINHCMELLSAEAKQVEYQGMWPLTCLGLMKFMGNVPGWHDFSMEEIRLGMYRAKAAGSFQYQKCLAELEVLLNKAKEARNLFIKGGHRGESIIIEMLKEGGQNHPTYASVPLLSKNSGLLTPPPSFNFVDAPEVNFTSQPSTGSFSLQSNPAFGGTSLAPSTPIFGLRKDPAPGLFSLAASQGTSQAFFAAPNVDTSIFGGQQRASIFGSKLEQNSNISQQMILANGQPLVQTAQPHSPFSQNLFGQVVPQASFITSTPQRSVPSFAQANVFDNEARQKCSSENIIYSQISDLTEEEIAQFQATTFTYGKIPFKPPPKELCT